MKEHRENYTESFYSRKKRFPWWGKGVAVLTCCFIAAAAVVAEAGGEKDHEIASRWCDVSATTVSVRSRTSLLALPSLLQETRLMADEGMLSFQESVAVVASLLENEEAATGSILVTFDPGTMPGFADLDIEINGRSVYAAIDINAAIRNRDEQSLKMVFGVIKQGRKLTGLVTRVMTEGRREPFAGWEDFGVRGIAGVGARSASFKSLQKAWKAGGVVFTPSVTGMRRYLIKAGDAWMRAGRARGFAKTFISPEHDLSKQEAGTMQEALQYLHQFIDTPPRFSSWTPERIRALLDDVCIVIIDCPEDELADHAVLHPRLEYKAIYLTQQEYNELKTDPVRLARRIAQDLFEMYFWYAAWEHHFPVARMHPERARVPIGTFYAAQHSANKTLLHENAVFYADTVVMRIEAWNQPLPDDITLGTSGFDFGEGTIREEARNLFGERAIQALKAAGEYDGFDLASVRRIVIQRREHREVPTVNAEDGTLTLFVTASTREAAERVRRELRQAFWQVLDVPRRPVDRSLTDEASQYLSPEIIAQIERIITWDIKDWTPDDMRAIRVKGRSIYLQLPEPITIAGTTYRAVKLKGVISDELLPMDPSVTYTMVQPRTSERIPIGIGVVATSEGKITLGQSQPLGGLQYTSTSNETAALQDIHRKGRHDVNYPLGEYRYIGQQYQGQDTGVNVSLVSDLDDVRVGVRWLNKMHEMQRENLLLPLRSLSLKAESFYDTSEEMGWFMAWMHKVVRRRRGMEHYLNQQWKGPGNRDIIPHDFEGAVKLPAKQSQKALMSSGHAQRELTQAVALRLADLIDWAEDHWNYFMQLGQSGALSEESIEMLYINSIQSFLYGYFASVVESPIRNDYQFLYKLKHGNAGAAMRDAMTFLRELRAGINRERGAQTKTAFEMFQDQDHPIISFLFFMECNTDLDSRIEELYMESRLHWQL